MSVIGGFEIQILAGLARLREEMNAAKGIVGDASAQMQRAADGVKSALAGIAAGLTVGALIAFVKQGIDAADMANELAQKTGLATKELAGIQLAFKQGGVASEAMGTSLAKMARQMVEGNAAFEALGVKTRAADGSLRSTKDVLYDTADAFAGIKDGAAKTSLAMEIFGKSGADMIPVLNGGAEGMREMAEMADKLGLTISDETAKAADQFNDQIELLGMGVKGVSTQVAAQLLPTLTSLSASFLESMTSGDRLRGAAEFLATALKGVYSAGVIGVEVFNTFGKVIGGVAAAVLSVAQGEFRQAQRILEETGRDVVKGWKGTAETIGRAWDTAGNTSMKAMAGMARAGREVTLQTKEQEAASKRAAAAAEKHAEELRKLTKAGDDLLKSLRDKAVVTTTEIALGRALTAGEKEHLELTIKLREGKVRMTEAVQAEARAQIDLNEQKLKHRALQVSEKTLQDEIEKDRLVAIASLQKETSSLAEHVARQREQNLELSLGEEAYSALTIQRLRDLAAQKEEIAATSDQSDELREQARLLRERADLAEQGIVLKEAKDAAVEWKKTTDSIGQGLTDSLFRAFESGKDFFSTFWQGIKNLFKTTVLKLAVQAVMNPVNALIGGTLGGVSGAANAGSAVGGLGNLAGGLGTFGSGLGAGFGALFGEAGIGGAMSAGGIAMGAGNIMGGLGTIIGALGPIALGLGAVFSLFKSLDSSGTPHVGGYAMAGPDGSIRDITAEQGGIGNATTQTAITGFAGTIAELLNNASRSFGGAGDFSVRSVLESDNTDPSWGLFHLLQNGEKQAGSFDALGTLDKDPTKAFEQYAGMAAAGVRTALESLNLPQWAAEALDALGESPSLQGLAAAVDKINAAQTALISMGEAVAGLGGPFDLIAGLSSDAKYQLAQFTGGIEAFVQKTRGYVGAYYSEAEQMAIAAREVLSVVGAAGIDGSGATAKSDLRALMETLNPNVEAERAQIAALLNVAAQYADVGVYLEKQGLTLGELAAQSPQIAALEQLQNPTQVTAEATAATAVSVASVATSTADTAASVASVAEGQTTQTAVLVEGMKAIVATLTLIDARLMAIEAEGALAAAAP